MYILYIALDVGNWFAPSDLCTLIIKVQEMQKFNLLFIVSSLGLPLKCQATLNLKHEISEQKPVLD